MRERLPMEIIPVSAEQSRTNEDNEDEYAASHAIDLDLDTRSRTRPDTDGAIWLKVKLANVNCIYQVLRYNENGNLYRNWTCSSTDCSTCEGSNCDLFALTVSIERGSSDGLPTMSDCKYGDTVTIQRTDNKTFSVYEVAVTGKQLGKIKNTSHINLIAMFDCLRAVR